MPIQVDTTKIEPAAVQQSTAKSPTQIAHFYTHEFGSRTNGASSETIRNLMGPTGLSTLSGPVTQAIDLLKKSGNSAYQHHDISLNPSSLSESILSAAGLNRDEVKRATLRFRSALGGVENQYEFAVLLNRASRPYEAPSGVLQFEAKLGDGGKLEIYGPRVMNAAWCADFDLTRSFTRNLDSSGLMGVMAAELLGKRNFNRTEILEKTQQIVADTFGISNSAGIQINWELQNIAPVDRNLSGGANRALVMSASMNGSPLVSGHFPVNRLAINNIGEAVLSAFTHSRNELSSSASSLRLTPPTPSGYVEHNPGNRTYSPSPGVVVGNTLDE